MAIDTILLAIGADDDDRAEALTRAVTEIAVPTGAEVILAHVLGEDDFEEVQDRLSEGGERLTPDQVADRHRTVRTISEKLRDAGIRPSIRGATGERGETIVTLAEETGADRIVIGGRSRSPTGKAVFGSTAQNILLSAPCPVTFVRGE